MAQVKHFVIFSVIGFTLSLPVAWITAGSKDVTVQIPVMENSSIPNPNALFAQVRDVWGPASGLGTRWRGGFEVDAQNNKLVIRRYATASKAAQIAKQVDELAITIHEALQLSSQPEPSLIQTAKRASWWPIDLVFGILLGTVLALPWSLWKHQEESPQEIES